MGLRDEQRQLLEGIDKLQGYEEELWRQKARVSWLWDRDRNTSCFFKYTRSRYAKNFVPKLIDASDNVLTDMGGIAAEAVKYFEELIGTRSPEVVQCSVARLQEFLSQRLGL